VQRYASALILSTILLVGACGSGAPTQVKPLATIEMDQLLSTLQRIPDRPGPNPTATFEIPHQQLNQPAPIVVQEELITAVAALPNVLLWESPNFLPGAISWILGESLNTDEKGDLTAGSEFGHQHRNEVGSMHLNLPAAASQIVLEKGWAVLHPLSAVIHGSRAVDYLLVYAPRDNEDLKIVWLIVQASYAFARGEL
jgi:hypothetical protein